MQRSRLRQRGTKAKREAPALEIFRLELRSRGWCEAQGIRRPDGAPVCGTTRAHMGEHPHHLWPEDRDAGIHDPARGLWICATSHNYAHAHSEEAKRLGLLRPER